jgi:hypothetical protein
MDGQYDDSEIVRIGIIRSSIFWTKDLCGCGLLWKKGRPVALLAAFALLKQSADGVATKQAGCHSPRHPWMFFSKSFVSDFSAPARCPKKYVTNLWTCPKKT